MPRDDAQDVLDLDAAWLDALYEVADDRLGNIERDGRTHQLPGEIEAIDGAFELAPALRQPVGEQGNHFAGDLEGGISGALFLRALLQHLEPQRRVHRADLGDEAALQARAHAVVETVELHRRPRRGHHHLTASVEQLVDDVLELLLGFFAAHELQIIDEQDVDGAELVLESHRILALDCLDELVAEAL